MLLHYLKFWAGRFRNKMLRQVSSGILTGVKINVRVVALTNLKGQRRPIRITLLSDSYLRYASKFDRG
jgi:hypothetical protein